MYEQCPSLSALIDRANEMESWELRQVMHHPFRPAHAFTEGITNWSYSHVDEFYQAVFRAHSKAEE